MVFEVSGFLHPKPFLVFILQKPPILYQRMYDAINMLVTFFNANDEGLPMQNIMNPLYQVSDLGC